MKKAYLGIKYFADQRNRDQIEALTAVLAKAGYHTTCIVRDLEGWGEYQFEPAQLMHKTFSVIESSDLAVIDLTEKGVGLGIEAGYAFAKGVPLVTVAKEGSDISTTLRGISRALFLYKDYVGLSQFFADISDSKFENQL